MMGNVNDIKTWVRNLVDNYYYLPYAHEIDLRRISKPCNTLRCIKENAIRILTEASIEAEEYRQIIYNLAFHGYIGGEIAYVLSKVGAIAIRNLTEAREELKRISEQITTGSFRKTKYKKIVEMMANLIQLNFAYSSVMSIIETISNIHKRPTQRKTIFPTIQSSALIVRMPIHNADRSIVPEDIAEALVDFCVSLRCKIVENFLRLKPKTSGDIIYLTYHWAKKELEQNYYSRLGDIGTAIKDMLWMHILREAFLAPYYLHHYGYIELDPVMYFITWELR